MRTIYVEDDAVFILDQSQLPAQVEYEKVTTHSQMAQAIKLLKVRGGPPNRSSSRLRVGFSHFQLS